MKPKGSLPCAQQPATCPCAQPNKSNQCPPNRSPPPTTHSFSKWSTSLRFPHQNSACTSHLLNTHHTCPTYHILLDLTTLLISDKDKSEAPDYALFSILLLNCTISIVLKDYGYPYASCTQTFNTAHYLTNYITISRKTNTPVCYLKGHVTYRTAVESLS